MAYEIMSGERRIAVYVAVHERVLDVNALV